MLVKLRELTGAGMSDCNAALKEANWDFNAAQDIIRRKGLDIAKKKSTREAKEGQIISYIHAGGKLGVIVEINCESDFVARNDQFQTFARDIAMQIAAAFPLYVSPDQIPAERREREKANFQAIKSVCWLECIDYVAKHKCHNESLQKSKDLLGRRGCAAASFFVFWWFFFHLACGDKKASKECLGVPEACEANVDERENDCSDNAWVGNLHQIPPRVGFNVP